ncbi:hypothetical protein V7147_19850 [Bacillus sp. JJ1521]|uniref:hypothetical protein n=1 Tax=Bacillus sp. JJ1521 TaxID=3122957 RepID=UPI002FFDB75A
MEKNELLLFKKPTDAVGANRGFIYQYLKTLVLWLKNYRNNKDMNIYCEVEDDIKESEEGFNRVNYTQLKCYSSVLSLKNEDVQKSLYNFFILFLINKEYEGTFAFETNTSISRNDKLLSNWSFEAGRLDLHPELLEESISKTREILMSELDKYRKSKETALQKNINEKNGKILKETDYKRKEKYLQEVEKWGTELREYTLKVEELKKEINNNEKLEIFVNRIQWEFNNISADDSLKALETNAKDILSDILRDDSDPYIYFCRLLTEVSIKATSENKEERMLNNELLKKILNETDDEINERISKVLMNNWEDCLRTGLDGIHGHLEEIGQKLEKKIDDLSSTNSKEKYLEEYALVDLPSKEDEEIESFLTNEQNDHQSKLELKIQKMENVDLDMKKSFLELGTEYRCRYLIYIEELKLTSTKSYQAVKKLESKVQRMCTRHTMGLTKNEKTKSNEVYSELEDNLDVLLNEFNFELMKNGIKVDSDIITGQMFHMAAKCSLRWHREVQVG